MVFHSGGLGRFEEALHPLTAATGIVIFANRSARFGLWLTGSGAALGDVEITALAARSQLPVEPAFDA